MCQYINRNNKKEGKHNIVLTQSIFKRQNIYPYVTFKDLAQVSYNIS